MMDYVTIIAAIQGILAATSIWQAERNYQLAIQTYDRTFSHAMESATIRERAIALQGVLPEDVAEVFQINLDECWGRYKECIRGASSTDSHERCEQENQECICSNLKYMANSNGCLPDEFKNLWNTFACGVKPIIC
jgi:hypothetical protein